MEVADPASKTLAARLDWAYDSGRPLVYRKRLYYVDVLEDGK